MNVPRTYERRIPAVMTMTPLAARGPAVVVLTSQVLQKTYGYLLTLEK